MSPFTLFLSSACEPSGFPELPKIVTTRSQWGTMDAATAQQLATAIQALATAAAALPPPPAPPAPAAPAADPLMSPYEGGPLDLASWHRSSLFHNGAQAVVSKFTGKANALQLFLANLKTRSKTCRWNHPTHGILTVAVDGTKYNLLDNYGKITDLQVEAAQAARNTADASPRAKQNSQMMYECLMASITEEAKSALASWDQDFHKDGPSLFFHVVSQLFVATFSNAQATCDNLSDFHLKRFRYDIIQVNNYISSAVMTLKAASSAGGTITDQEILYFQFKVYKKIKALQNGLLTSFSWSPPLQAPRDTPQRPCLMKRKPSTQHC